MSLFRLNTDIYMVWYLIKLGFLIFLDSIINLYVVDRAISVYQQKHQKLEFEKVSDLRLTLINK